MVATGQATNVVRKVYADFHIHVGQSDGRPVKMAASKSLTVDSCIRHAKERKGLDIITIIDGVCDGPLAQLREKERQGALRVLPGGGLECENGLVVFPGAEVEVAGPYGGLAHFGCWFRDMTFALDFQAWLKTVQRNTSLSSQRARCSALELQSAVHSREGIFIVHHAFTPHRGMYGNCVRTMAEMVNPSLVDGLELGLSANTDMADRLGELETVTFVTNSDAHSTPRIGREYNQLELGSVDFDGVKKALRCQEEHRVTANYGMHPALGKYHGSGCSDCGQPWVSSQTRCLHCGSGKRTMGVADRLEEIATLSQPVHPPMRPPYVSQVPLSFVKGLGPRSLERLFAAFGTEMDVLHRASLAEIIEVVGENLGNAIEAARSGNAHMVPGRNGVYGRLSSESKPLAL